MADPSFQDLADKVDDLSRIVARQSAALGQLADARARPGTDVPLLVELHALRGEAMAAAEASRSSRERAVFEVIAGKLERLMAGRGGMLVVPRPGHPFSAATMAADDEVACADAALDRTVAALLEPGLDVEGRSVRRARVAVHRYAPRPAEPATNGHAKLEAPSTDETAPTAAGKGPAERAPDRKPAQQHRTSRKKQAQKRHTARS